MTDDPQQAQEFLSLVGIMDWAPLGGGVELKISPRRTVLVGRNGSGKSLLVAGLGHLLEQRAKRTGSQPSVAAGHPNDLVLGFQQAGRFSLFYAAGSEGEVLREFFEAAVTPSARATLVAALAGRLDPAGAATELCLSFGEQGSHSSWVCRDGVLLLDGEGTSSGPLTVLDFVVPRKPGSWGSMAQNPATQRLRDTVERVSRVFFGARLVPAGIPRHASLRSPILLDASGVPTGSSLEAEQRLGRLVARLHRWNEASPELFAEVAEFGRRNRLWSRLEVVPYRAGLKIAMFGVHVDDVNLGLLPDGTLRVLEIAVELIDPEVKLLLVEEPETASHPWLLGRLLAEMDAACDTRQIVVSTHAPMVVDWASPEEIRLVERTDGKTTVRGLSDEERARVHTYLSDEGTLAEYVYERTEA